MKIGFLGGTFDPIHNAHIELAQAAQKQLDLNRVDLVLSPLSPYKIDHDLTPVPLRLEMLRAALDGKKKLAVGEYELKRKGPSYTVNTLTEYKKKNPSHEIFLIMGSDALAGFNGWKQHQKILKMATLVIGRRPGMPLQLSGFDGEIVFLKGLFPKISSTAIRYQARKGLKMEGVAPTVAAVIRKYRIYER